MDEEYSNSAAQVAYAVTVAIVLVLVFLAISYYIKRNRLSKKMDLRTTSTKTNSNMKSDEDFQIAVLPDISTSPSTFPTSTLGDNSRVASIWVSSNLDQK